MSIASEITRLTNLKTKIKTKLIAWGLVQSTADLSACANAIDALNGYTDISASIVEGETYRIPQGYHNGSGTVSAVGGGGNYELQSKTVQPTYSEQTVTPDTGKYGLDSVVVGAIPSSYVDVSGVTATADKVLTGSMFIASDGSAKNGSMANQGRKTLTMDGISTTSVTIPKGYHDGTGSVSLTSAIETALSEI